MNVWNEIKKSFRSGSILIKLIYINVGIWGAIWVLYMILMLLSGGQLEVFKPIEYLTLPAYLPYLVLRPWTPITYMFSHLDFLHILFNLLWLYWFGRVFLQFLSEKQLLSMYLLGGFAGAVLYIVAFNLLPAFRPSTENPQFMLGASASVTAIIFAIAFYMPKYKMNLVFIGPVQIIWIALIAFFITTITDFQSNTGGKIAHIGGAVYGYLFAVQLRKGNDLTAGFSRLLERFFAMFGRKKKMSVSYKSNEKKRKTTRAETDLDYNARKVAEQAEIDAILDKIAKSGYDSLTKKEKETLFKSSNN
ncbi:MAG: rhomboid family intramembrane serine protease [Bacteroidetes bacterium]|nr:rhomboid family intramembrane serine protease [Bacteroidota bacterium]